MNESYTFLKSNLFINFIYLIYNKLKVFISLLLLLLSLINYGQSIDNYAFSTSANGSLVKDAYDNTIDMSSGTIQMIGESSTANTSSALLNLNTEVDPFVAPFEFWFMGVRYTNFSVNENGVISLGAAITPGQVAIGVASQALIAPFTQDLNTSITGQGSLQSVWNDPKQSFGNRMEEY